MVKKAIGRVRKNSIEVYTKIKNKLNDRSGEGYVDTGIKILIAVVIGAVLLAGLYALFGDTILPTLTQKIQDMFNYKGQ
ncbi:DUF6133 family protein [Xylanivirga thermophila]|uniref:DUF6133 family protein n=1 Tax=Xylanivirga thermophila TaxID=2496273 RepID=UPI00101DE867|nr:DUF6133 family protein [Xylanivirga thermophila]